MLSHALQAIIACAVVVHRCHAFKPSAATTSGLSSTPMARSETPFWPPCSEDLLALVLRACRALIAAAAGGRVRLVKMIDALPVRFVATIAGLWTFDVRHDVIYV
jgi:hypothetical protein